MLSSMSYVQFGVLQLTRQNPIFQTKDFNDMFLWIITSKEKSSFKDIDPISAT